MSASTKLSEVDKLILKIDQIYADLGGETDPNFFDTSKVKDKFDKLRVEVNRGIGDVEALLNQKDTLTGSDKIQEKYIIDGKIEDKMTFLSKQIKELEIELKSQKKKSSKEDLEYKTELVENFNKRYLMIKNRFEGIEVKDNEYNDNIAKIDQLEDIIQKQKGGPTRELYQEEKDKMDEWDKRVDDQNRQLEMIGKGVKDLKQDAKEIGKEINNVHKAIKQTSKAADNTSAKLETTNKKLKDMLEKIRGSNKICLDIVLICICLGLAAVLYNLITNYL